MPLAFMQEDFHVYFLSSFFFFVYQQNIMCDMSVVSKSHLSFGLMYDMFSR